MVQIAVKLENEVVSNIATDKSAQVYALKTGWTLVESDPAFLISERFNWTVRQSDNKLVHVSTGMTPDEESTQANALLGKQVGTALSQATVATTTANSAIDIANKSVAANAELGKVIAPILAAFQQGTTNTTGGTN